ncbi:GNAT family N-acetyltransferase [Burkholderia multivorans]|uniref:GNAT family N-acetyltransferase n=1 Tax=Burkholderia multivorans TaxID=87883 RepID=UPI001C260DBF|nr:GNAT family N-acetyltransferase [Burkholderia multivorans]MBU9564504.1 GNAT family N-acetyltransferase [Burkholderia multivorans]
MSKRSHEEQVAFLVETGASQVSHSGRTFLDHLLGVENLLKRWECNVDVQAAGLFHSVYGTNRFKTALVGLHARPLVAQLIGRDAEELAFLFCSSERPQAWLDACATGKLVDRRSGKAKTVSKALLGRLIEMECANLIEQGSGNKFLKNIPAVAKRAGIVLNASMIDEIVTQSATRDNHVKVARLAIDAANPADYSSILTLARQLHVDSRYASIRFDEASTKRFITSAADDPGHCIFVARIGGEPQGFLHGVLHELSWANAKVALCEHLYVAPRRRGLIGLRLLHEFKRWARKAGAVELRMLDTFGDNVVRSRAYFERLGLDATGGSFALWL